MSKVKVVVTGASGFIGGHLVAKLSRISEIAVVPTSRRKIPNFQFVSHYSEAPEGNILIHLAENNYVQGAGYDESSYEHEYVETTCKLLEKRYEKFVYVSSSTLYGDNSKIPRQVNDEVFVDNFYSRIKRSSELATLDHSSGIVIRLANVYGPEMSSKNVLSHILNQIPLEGDLILENCSPIRDFVWVQDVVRGIIKLAFTDFTSVEGLKLYNIGSGVGTSIGDLARMTLDLAGQPERRVVSTNSSGKTSSVVLNISETTKVCGWTPKVSLRDGIKKIMTVGLDVSQ
jgi:UDP-glucose 4-epimerase